MKEQVVLSLGDGQSRPLETRVALEINGAPIAEGGLWIRSGPYGRALVMGDQREFGERLAACWNACASYADPADIPTRAAVEAAREALKRSTACSSCSCHEHKLYDKDATCLHCDCTKALELLGGAG